MLLVLKLVQGLQIRETLDAIPFQLNVKAPIKWALLEFVKDELLPGIVQMSSGKRPAFP